MSRCKNGGNCEINKKNRTSCKACRLRKCILAGMSKSSSRYGRRSNSFKESYALQEQEEGEQSNERSHAAASYSSLCSPVHPLLSAVIYDDKSDAASTQENHTNNTTNSHELYSHIMQRQLSISLLSTLSQVASSSADNPIQQGPTTTPIPLSFMNNPFYPSLEGSTSKITSDSEMSDVESKDSSTRVSPTFTYKTDERALTNSTPSSNESSMLTNIHTSHLNNSSYLSPTPSFNTWAACSAKDDDLYLWTSSPETPTDKPIDLSMRASSSSSQFNESSEKKKKKEDR